MRDIIASIVTLGNWRTIPIALKMAGQAVLSANLP